MIQTDLKPDSIHTGVTTHVELQITNKGEIAVQKIFLAIKLSPQLEFLRGNRRIEIASLEPGETYVSKIELRSAQPGTFYLTSDNFSYRIGNIGQRIADLKIPLNVENPQRRSTAPISVESQRTIPPSPTPIAQPDRHSEVQRTASWGKPVGPIDCRIFISYSRRDKDFAAQLAGSLSQTGATVWIDVEGIHAGIKWSTAIQDALKSSEVMLVILSPDAMKSGNVEDEWQYFLDNKKIIIPILWRPAEVHFQLSRLQYVDFHTKSYDEALRKLFDELVRLC